jgi:hypothetical protein
MRTAGRVLAGIRGGLWIARIMREEERCWECRRGARSSMEGAGRRGHINMQENEAVYVSVLTSQNQNDGRPAWRILNDGQDSF